MAPIVTLTTDWGDSGFFGGMVKGRLYSQIPDVRVVDIAHNIEPHELRNAVYVIKNSCGSFPQGTIHIIDIKSDDRKRDEDVNLAEYIAMECNGQYYVCANNGLLSVAFGNDHGKVVGLPVSWTSASSTFAALEVFVPAVVRMATGTPLEAIGQAAQLKLMTWWYPVVDQAMPNVPPSQVSVVVQHIDNYGNAHLNLLYRDFEQIRNGRSFQITFSDNTKISRFVQRYTEASDGDPILTVSATGYLQVALSGMSAAQLLGIRAFDRIEIRFIDK